MTQETQVALVTGASSGFGRMIAGELAAAGLVAYASMRDTGGKNADTVRDMAGEAKSKGVDLRTIELDVQDEASAETAAASSPAIMRPKPLEAPVTRATCRSPAIRRSPR